MKVTLPQLSKSLNCEKGENLFRTLRAADTAVASSCQGDGICGKCVVKVLKGAENLSPPTELELKLKEKYSYSESQRISCQTEVLGDVEIATTYW